jgi:hypothetical protein
MISFKIGFDPGTGHPTFFYPSNLAVLHLRVALNAANELLRRHPDPDRDAVAAGAAQSIVFAAFAVEAAANGTAATMLKDDELDDFVWGRGALKTGRPKKVSLSVWKWRWLLVRKGWTGTLDDEPVVGIREVFEARNAIAHFEPLRASSQVAVQADLWRTRPDGSRELDLRPPADQPHEIRWGLVERYLTPTVACRSYMRARALMLAWHHLVGGPPGAESMLPEIDVPEAPQLPTKLSPLQSI